MRKAEEERFHEFVAARMDRWRRSAFLLCRDWHTADDLVQLTFVKLYPQWRRVRDGSVDAYVRRILVNTYLSHVRKHRREKVVAEVPETPAPEADSHEGLSQALRRLPPQQRAVVVLRHLEDLSIADVAEVLHLAEGTVKSQSARGVAALRAAMIRSAQPKEL